MHKEQEKTLKQKKLETATIILNEVKKASKA